MILSTGDRKISIFSKKLSSGNCQVKFFIDSKAGKPYYGYLLVESGKKVSEVIAMIYQKFCRLEEYDEFNYMHSGRGDGKKYFESGFMLFEDIKSEVSFQR
jgi:hypothetical protein